MNISQPENMLDDLSRQHLETTLRDARQQFWLAVEQAYVLWQVLYDECGELDDYAVVWESTNDHKLKETINKANELFTKCAVKYLRLNPAADTDPNFYMWMNELYDFDLHRDTHIPHINYTVAAQIRKHQPVSTEPVSDDF